MALVTGCPTGKLGGDGAAVFPERCGLDRLGGAEDSNGRDVCGGGQMHGPAVVADEQCALVHETTELTKVDFPGQVDDRRVDGTGARSPLR